MISKWIVELAVAYKTDDRELWEHIIEKVDELLKRAMHETDNNNLTDEIRKLINGE